MLDLTYIREHPDVVKKAIEDKQLSLDVDHILNIDAKRHELQITVQQLQEKRNLLTRAIKGKPTEEQIAIGKRLREELDKEESALSAVQEELHTWLMKVPNIPADDVPVGRNETDNIVIREEGKKPTFSFTPKHHEELASALDLFESKRAVAIGGFRTYMLKGDLVLLEQAVLRYALDMMATKGFSLLTAPVLVNKEALWGTGYFPWGSDDHYTTQDGQGLAGTSEVALTAYHQNTVLNESDLPIKLSGISPCFRREVGTYGKDTKGFMRVHQFNKVEQVILTVADESVEREMHEYMLSIAEELLQSLGLSYRVVLMCTGDMGAGQRKKYDIETWFAGQNEYRETHSASYFNDFQSRRLNIRYRTKHGETKYVYTLNNTVVATPRILGAIFETYQNENGSITVPEILVPYMKKTIIEKR
jgi:seryl-tRNA synthetase